MSTAKPLEHAEHHRNSATELRLAKQPKNPGLQKAHNYKTIKQLAHKTASQQQKSSKSQVADSKIQFIIYMRMSQYGPRSQPVSCTLSPLNYRNTAYILIRSVTAA